MRLTDEQARSIREVVGRHFGTKSRIWLFGSRSDDSRSGGDIDLYLEPEQVAGSNLFLAKQAARHELEQKLHWPVDLVVRRDRETAFMRAAKSDGIPLWPNIVQSTEDWERQRSLRNAVGHEYPDVEGIVDIMNGIAGEVPAILDYVDRLQVRASVLLEKT